MHSEKQRVGIANGTRQVDDAQAEGPLPLGGLNCGHPTARWFGAGAPFQLHTETKSHVAHRISNQSGF